MANQRSAKKQFFLGFLMIMACVTVFSQEVLAASKMPHFVLSSADEGKEIDIQWLDEILKKDSISRVNTTPMSIAPV